MISKKAVFYSAGVLTLSNTLLQILGFVYRIVISRMAGAEGMGVYQLIFPYYNIIMGITVTGLTTAINCLAAEKQSLFGNNGVRKLVGTALSIILLLFVVILLFTLCCGDWISGTLLGDRRTGYGILLLLPCLFFTGFENIFKAAFFGINRVIPPAASELLEQTVRIVAVAFLLAFSPVKDPSCTTALIVLGMIISELFSSGTLAVLFRKYISKHPSQRPIKRMSREIFSIAIPLAAGGLIINLLSSLNKIMIPQRLMAYGLTQKEALESFGILFGMTLPLLMLPSIFVTSLSTTVMPRISKSLALQNNRDVQRKISKTIHVTGLLIFPLIAIMIPLGDTLCDLLYRQPLAAQHIVPLGIAVAFLFYEMITMSILNGIGLQRKGAFHMVIGSVIELILTYVLTGIYGINGYIAAFFCGTVYTVLCNLWIVLKHTSLHIEMQLWFVHPLLSALVTGLFVNAFHACFLQSCVNPYFPVILSLMLGLLVYAAILRLQGIHLLRYLCTLVPAKNRADSLLCFLQQKGL